MHVYSIHIVIYIYIALVKKKHIYTHAHIIPSKSLSSMGNVLIQEPWNPFPEPHVQLQFLKCCRNASTTKD